MGGDTLHCRSPQCGNTKFSVAASRSTAESEDLLNFTLQVSGGTKYRKTDDLGVKRRTFLTSSEEDSN